MMAEEKRMRLMWLVIRGSIPEESEPVGVFQTEAEAEAYCVRAGLDACLLDGLSVESVTLNPPEYKRT